MAYPEPDYVKKCVYFVGGPPGRGGQTRAQRHADPASVGGFAPVPCAPTPRPGIAIGKFSDSFWTPYECGSAGAYNFVFQLITGFPAGTPGANIPWPSITSPAMNLTGTSFITYLGVYLGGAGGIGPPPPPGASIDALDLTTGFLLNGLNGNFVTVDDEPGNVPDASLTTSGNVYGWVPTSLPESRGRHRTGVKITALGQLGLSGPNFCGWLDLLNPPANGILPSANDISFTALENENYYRLACYSNSPLMYGPGPNISPGVVIIGIDGKITFIPGLGGPPVVIENGRVVGSSENKI